MVDLSVIIPIGPAERGWGTLLGDLLLLPQQVELVFVTCPQSARLHRDPQAVRILAERPLVWIAASTGRAVQMNAGAAAARGGYLWFLHVDSHFGPEAWQALMHSLKLAPQALHYFRLQFRADGPRTVRLNAYGANLRSRCGVPFGDQAFCLHRDLFKRLGGYPEQAPYGEDHLLVWRAHQTGTALRCTGQCVQTSARKYQHQGWGRLTLRYQWMWLCQAFPQWWRLITRG